MLTGGTDLTFDPTDNSHSTVEPTQTHIRPYPEKISNPYSKKTHLAVHFIRPYLIISAYIQGSQGFIPLGKPCSSPAIQSLFSHLGFIWRERGNILLTSSSPARAWTCAPKESWEITPSASTKERQPWQNKQKMVNIFMWLVQALGRKNLYRE